MSKIEILQSWPTKKLGELKITTFKGTSVQADSNRGNIILIPSGAVFPEKIQLENTKRVFLKDNQKLKTIKLQRGDILFNTGGVGTLGRSALITKEIAEIGVIPDSFILVIRSQNIDILNRYLFFVLQTSFIKRQIQKNTFGSTGITSIKPEAILNFDIPLPSLEIQQKIVERLDTIKKTQELNDKQITLADELKKSLIHNFETVGKKWPRVQLGKCVSFLQLGLVRSKEKYSDKGVPYLKMDVIQSNGELDFKKAIKVIADENEIQRYKLKIGDFLFNTRNTPKLVGKSAVFNEKGIYLFNNNILRLRFKNLLPLFLNAFFQTTDGEKSLNSKKKGTTSVWAIYQSDLFKIKIPLPSLEIQRKIVEKLSVVQDYKKKLLEQKQKLQELFESVLSKSVKGKLI